MSHPARAEGFVNTLRNIRTYSCLEYFPDIPGLTWCSLWVSGLKSIAWSPEVFHPGRTFLSSLKGTGQSWVYSSVPEVSLEGNAEETKQFLYMPTHVPRFGYVPSPQIFTYYKMASCQIWFGGKSDKSTLMSWIKTIWHIQSKNDTVPTLAKVRQLSEKNIFTRPLRTSRMWHKVSF